MPRYVLTYVDGQGECHQMAGVWIADNSEAVVQAVRNMVGEMDGRLEARELSPDDPPLPLLAMIPSEGQA